MSGAELGILLPTRAAGSAHGSLSLATRAETLGFDSVWAGESILARPRLDPLMMLAAIAATTSRLRLGTAVLLPAQHQPLRLAHMLATLDALAGGRLIVGTGIGVASEETQEEFRALGVAFDGRVGRLLEFVRLCRTLWSDSLAALCSEAPGRVNRYWDLGGVRLETRPARPAGPAFWVGSTFQVEASLRRAGRHFDGWFPTAPGPDAYHDGWRIVRDAAVAAGRDPQQLTPALYLTVNVDPDEARAERELSTFMEGYYDRPYALMRQIQGCYAGDAQGCARWLEGFVEAGARHIVLRFGTSGPTAQLERAAQELLPAIRGR